MHLLRQIPLWTSAALLAVLPIVVAADYGGVLRWTQYVAALAIAAAAVLALAGLFGQDHARGLRRHALLLPLGLWAAFAWLQIVPLPAAVTATLSPATAAAYTDWIEPFVGKEAASGEKREARKSEQPENRQHPPGRREGLALSPGAGSSSPLATHHSPLSSSSPLATHHSPLSSFPISVAPRASRHAAAFLLLLCGLAWAASIAFSSRLKIAALLSVVAVGASVHAAIGILGLIDTATLPMVVAPEIDGAHFGFFVNRNNAALLMYLGLAASLGLLSWRLAALTGIDVDDPSFEFNDLMSLVSDRDSFIGLAGSVLCISGLLVGGSRGGVAAALVGGLLAFGWVRQRRGYASLPVVALVIAACVTVLLVPTDLSLESIQQFEIFSGSAHATLLEDGRLDHWPDGLRAALAHLPAGSGLSSYAYAYLPHQATSSRSWFHHADNLWLELFVEQGILGIVLALAIFAVVIRALGRLSGSADPIDQGLRIAGWYAIGAIVVSQAFDFGLIVPANTFLVTTLFAAITARAASVGAADPLVPAAQRRASEGEAASREKREAAAGEAEYRQHPPAQREGRALSPGEGSSAPLATHRSPSASSRTPDAGHRSPNLFRRGASLASFAVAAAALAATAASLGPLQSGAATESLMRTAEVQWEWIGGDPDEVDRWSERLAERLQADPSPQLALMLADFRRQQARLEEVAAAAPPTTEAAVELFRQTAPEHRRLIWHRAREEAASGEQRERGERQGKTTPSRAARGSASEGRGGPAPQRSSAPREGRALSSGEGSSAPLPSSSPLATRHSPLSSGYRDALSLATHALNRLPLSRQARKEQIYLDFVHRDADRTQAALEQLQRLYATHPQRLIELGRLAAGSGQTEMAKRLWQRALRIEPGRARAVIAVVQQRAPELPLTQVVPADSPEALRRAAAEVLRAGEPQRHEDLLRTALAQTDCGAAETLAERAACEELAGDLAYALGQTPRALEHYAEAIKRAPDDPRLRLKYIRRLQQQGRQSDALIEARKARLLMPENQHFDQILEEAEGEERRAASSE